MSVRLLAVVVVLTAPVVALAAPVPQDAAAVVNSVPIERKALLDVVQSVIAQLDDVPDTPTTEKYRRQALDSLIDFELLYQDGQSRGLLITAADVKEAIKATEKSFPSAKDYEKALKAKGLTRQDIEKETRRALLVNRVLADVVWPGVAAKDADVQAYYDAHKSEFSHPDEIRASYILIRAKKDAADRAAARSKAAGLAKRAAAGEDFSGLARQSSDDPATAQTGGDLGFISRGTMGEAFDRAAFAVEPGQVSDVVDMAFGFMVIKVVAKRPAGVAQLAEVRDRIAGTLKEQGRQKAQQEFVATLRSKAKIDIAPDLR